MSDARVVFCAVSRKWTLIHLQICLPSPAQSASSSSSTFDAQSTRSLAFSLRLADVSHSVFSRTRAAISVALTVLDIWIQVLTTSEFRRSSKRFRPYALYHHYGQRRLLGAKRSNTDRSYRLATFCRQALAHRCASGHGHRRVGRWCSASRPIHDYSISGLRVAVRRIASITAAPESLLRK